jgi:hypothetical protein
MTTQELNRLLRRTSVFSLLITGIAQVISIMLFELEIKSEEIEEFHEICGFTFLGLILFHLVVFRKNIRNLLSSKTL